LRGAGYPLRRDHAIAIFCMKTVMPFRCGLVLLAAGASRRMGTTKQLLTVAGRPLVRFVAEQALAAPVAPVIVVLGAHAPEIAPCLSDLPVQIVVNAQWERGMASSLRAGIQALTEGAPEIEAVIIALADQPGCSFAHLARLIETCQATGKSMVASAKGDVIGPPVLIAAQWFHRLLRLDGDTGARELLREQPGSVATVPLANAMDLDTPLDYERFVRMTTDEAQPSRAT
jgi:molybdenum cofactor cytidylyltransferase